MADAKRKGKINGPLPSKGPVYLDNAWTGQRIKATKALLAVLPLRDLILSQERNEVGLFPPSLTEVLPQHSSRVNKLSNAFS